MRVVIGDTFYGFFIALGFASILGCGPSSKGAGQFILVDREAGEAIRRGFPDSAELLEFDANTSMMRVDEDVQGAVSGMMHDLFNRCGGYFAFDFELEARDWSATAAANTTGASALLGRSYTMDQPELVARLHRSIRPKKVISTITKLSSYKTRFYQSTAGQESQQWIASQWRRLGKGRRDFSVELRAHSGWPQPSVVATIRGTQDPDEIVILGGHGDSLNARDRTARAHAPGADDNASGIAAITETLRVILDSGWKPRRTLKFFSYAAEEVGLRGSRDIAREYAATGKEVLGVMQFDLTGHSAPNEKINLIQDYTNYRLNRFVGKLLKRYTGIKYVKETCGYACSDHAAWHESGFPATHPFEAPKNHKNPKMHTTQDVIRNMDSSGRHSAKFVQLALAYMAEVSK